MAGHNVRREIILAQIELVNRVGTVLLAASRRTAGHDYKSPRDFDGVGHRRRPGGRGSQNVIGRKKYREPAAGTEMKAFGRLGVARRCRGEGIIDDQFAFFFLGPRRREGHAQRAGRPHLIFLRKILRRSGAAVQLNLQIGPPVSFGVGKNDIDKIERRVPGILQRIGVVQAQFRGSSGDELNLEGLFHDLVAGGERHGARNRAAQNRGGKNGDTDFARRVETFQDSEILPEWGTKVAMASKK